MAYRCVHCSEIFPDGSKEVLNGCNCGGKFFFYIKEDKLKQIQENQALDPELTASEKNQIENDVRDIAGIKDEEAPIFLDFESIKILKPGKYLIDLSKMFSVDKPKIYKLEDGKYIIDLTALMKEKRKEQYN